MPATPHPRALIAEDEPLLAAALQQALQTAWPQLQVVASVGDGASAVQQSLALCPDILFFDIRMPGMGGIEAAQALAEQWPASDDAVAPKPFPSLVFVTAYDEYAVQAFEAQAVDYLLKPVQPQRLEQSVQRLRSRWQDSRADNAMGQQQLWDASMAQLSALVAAHGAQINLSKLSHIQAGVGNSIHMVPLEDVLYFEAADKYVRVITADHEYLIRTPLKDLLPRLDTVLFWQIHRGTVVRASAIESVIRDPSGKLNIRLKSKTELLQVSRIYTHLFRAM